MRSGKPSVHGIHTGFRTESEDTGKDNGKEELFISRDAHKIEEPALHKAVRIRRVVADDEDREKTHQGTCDRIKQIFEGCRYRFPAHLMEDQRHRCQSRHLKAQVQRDQIGCKGDREQRTEA